MTKNENNLHSNKRRIRGIVDELVKNALNAGARQIKIQIDTPPDFFEIRVEDDGSGMDPKQAEEVRAMLQQPRREELEDYYGGLAGVTGFGSGLSIVGMMVDEAQVESALGRGTRVRVKRWHKKD